MRRRSWLTALVMAVIVPTSGLAQGASPGMSPAPPSIEAPVTYQAVPLAEFRTIMKEAWDLSTSVNHWLDGEGHDDGPALPDRVTAAVDALQAGLLSGLPEACYRDFWLAHWPVVGDLRHLETYVTDRNHIGFAVVKSQLLDDVAALTAAFDAVRCDDT